MPYELPGDVLTDLNRSSRHKTYTPLIRISHPDWTDPVRLAANTEDVVNAEGTWTQALARLTPPPSDGERLSAVGRVLLSSLALNGILVTRIRQVDPSVDIVVQGFVIDPLDDPDVVLKTWPEVVMRNISYPLQGIEADLVKPEEWDREPLGQHVQNPSNSPGLFSVGS